MMWTVFRHTHLTVRRRQHSRSTSGASGLICRMRRPLCWGRPFSGNSRECVSICWHARVDCASLCLCETEKGPHRRLRYMELCIYLAAGLAGAVVLVSFSGAFLQSRSSSASSTLLGVAPGAGQQRLEQLDGGFWSSLDNSVPLKSAASEVDIGGRVLPMHQARRARPVAGQIDGGQFLSDSVRRDPNHLGIYGGMYWGQQTAPKKARGRRSGDKWLRAPARGQRGAHGRDSDAEVGGIIHALEHQKSPAPPEWWVRKRQEWLRKQRLKEAKEAITKHLIKINPDFTGTPLDHARDMGYAHGPALSGLRPVSLHANPRKSKAPAKLAARHGRKTHSPASDILILPGKHLVHPRSAAALDLANEKRAAAPAGAEAGTEAEAEAEAHTASPRETTVKEALDRAEAIRHTADKRLSKHDRDQAAALEKTAASLRKLASAMSGKRFDATPNKLATIAKQVSPQRCDLDADAVVWNGGAGGCAHFVR